MSVPEQIEDTRAEGGVDMPGSTPLASLPFAPSFSPTSRQLALFGALAEKSGEAGSFYMGALRVLADRDNPLRTAFAAYGVRELMDKLPVLTSAPAKVRKGNLGNKVVVVASALEQAKRNSQSHENGAWSGPIDHHVQGVLDKVDEMIVWHETYMPKRTTVAVELSRHLDVSRRPLPTSVEERHAKHWVDLIGYFNAVLHGGSTDEAKFADRLNEFEQFVLDRLRPRTSEEMGVLDALIAEAERGA